MYLEESIRKTKMVSSDRFVFTSEQASFLPEFPFNPDCIRRSPYLPILINENILCPYKNPMGLNINEYKEYSGVN
jgi:hypothetical protein